MSSTETRISLEFLSLIEILERGDDGIIKCTQITKRSKKHCGHPVKGNGAKNWEDLYDLLDKHAGGTLPEDDLSKIVESLLGNYLCHFRHKKNKTTAKTQWRSELSNDDERIRLHERLKIKFSTQNEGTSICSTPPSLSKSSSPTPPSTPSRSLPATPPDFKHFDESPRQTPIKQEVDIAEKVTSLVLKNLGDLDEKPGFIYLIGHPKEEQMFKVGHTADLERRLKDHKNCLGSFKRISTTYIRFAHRIEQLILAEFRLQRCKLVDKCDKCDVIHKEWIHAQDKGLLMESLEKWIDFANGDRSPYENDGTVDNYVRLPLPALPGANNPKSRPRRKSSQRVDASPSPEPTPLKKKSSRADGSQLQDPPYFVPDVDDSGSESSLLEEGVSKLNLGPKKCETDNTDQPRTSPAWPAR